MAEHRGRGSHVHSWMGGGGGGPQPGSAMAGATRAHMIRRGPRAAHDKAGARAHDKAGAARASMIRQGPQHDRLSDI